MSAACKALTFSLGLEDFEVKRSIRLTRVIEWTRSATPV